MIKLRLQIFAAICGLIASMHGASSSYKSDLPKDYLNDKAEFLKKNLILNWPVLDPRVHILVPTGIQQVEDGEYKLEATRYRYNMHPFIDRYNSSSYQEDISVYIGENIPSFPFRYGTHVSWRKASIPLILSFLSYACARRITDSVTRAYCAAAGAGLLGAGLLYWQACKNLPNDTTVREVEADLLKQYLIPHIDALKDSVTLPSTRIYESTSISSSCINDQSRDAINNLFPCIKDWNNGVIDGICYDNNGNSYGVDILQQPAVWKAKGSTIPDRIERNAFWTSALGAVGAMSGLGAHYVLTHGGLKLTSVFK